ncbi:MAG: FAD-binding protein [Planctomycetota bacterium]|nr:MAG: FAD-binding protein [Planctomycetota bacterium]
MAQSPSIWNFGHNIALKPSAYYEPRDENELLDILNRHPGEQIRAIGSLHSWSAAPACEGVVICLKHLQQCHFPAEHAGEEVTVGAGCQIKTLLEYLRRHGKTLPSVGLITEQTIAGAISTGTHGSGRHSLSHYVEAVRVARFDQATGKAFIEQIDSGEVLQAARCSLGCLGIILAVRIRCRDLYRIEEHWREHADIDAALAAEKEFPLQQLFLVPWRWTLLAQHRRESSAPRSRLAGLYRVYWFLCIDLGMHLLLILAARWLQSASLVRLLLRSLIPAAVIRGWKVTDESSAMLVMKHELFRHIETEIFIEARHLPAALAHFREVLTVAADVPESRGFRSAMTTAETEALEALRGTYCHHYPICVRRVLADDTLISMAAGKETIWYTISLISYARPTDRQGFQLVATYLMKTMADKFQARPHWGKWLSLPPQSLVSLYPHFPTFRDTCQSRDPAGVFRNAWLSSLMDDQPCRR